MRRKTFFSRRVLALGTALVTIGATAGGTLAATSGSSSSNHRLSVGSKQIAMARSVPNELKSSFTSFRRAAEPIDALPAAAQATVTHGGSSSYGLNPSLSRLVGEAGGSKIWLVPGTSGSCLYDTLGGGAVCGPNADVSTYGLSLLLVPVSGAQPTLVGVVPDGATVTATDPSGATTSIPTSSSVFRVTGNGGGKVTIQSASGGSQALSIPSPSPAPAGPPAEGSDAQPPVG